MLYAVCTHLTKVTKTNFWGDPSNQDAQSPSSNAIIQALQASSQVIVFNDKNAALAFADRLAKDRDNTSACYIDYPLVLEVSLKEDEQYECWAAKCFIDRMKGETYDTKQALKVTTPGNIASIISTTYKYGWHDQACTRKESFVGDFPSNNLASSHYLSFESFTAKVKQIEQRFLTSPYTKQKSEVFANFGSFYAAHCHNPAFMPRTKLVKQWINAFQQEHGKNPFTILNQQRYTGLLSIFNPPTTDSQNLFCHFLVGESIAPDLKTLMRAESTKAPSFSRSIL